MVHDDRRDPKADRTGDAQPARPTINAFGRRIRVPASRPLRIASGAALVAGGVFGFLPVLGFWMVPMGLLVLSYDIATVRRWRRRGAVWWHRRKGTK
jgi:hypothetical protein